MLCASTYLENLWFLNNKPKCRVSWRPGNSRYPGNGLKFVLVLDCVLKYRIVRVLPWKYPENDVEIVFPSPNLFLYKIYWKGFSNLPTTWYNNSCICFFPTFYSLFSVLFRLREIIYILFPLFKGSLSHLLLIWAN